MHRLFRFFLLLLFAAGATSALQAHGDLHARIVAITQQIQTHPDSVELYLKRGELYEQHEEYDLAMEDFSHCRRSGMESARLHLGFAKTHFRLGQDAEALHSLDRILQSDPGHVIALRSRGRVLNTLGDFRGAADCFEKVIDFSETTFTENYLEASRAWLQTDGSKAGKRAVNVLNRGLEDLGPLVALLQELVAVHETKGDWKEAIAHQSRILHMLQRKEYALLRRAELHLAAGNTESAEADLNASRSAIDELPQRRKQDRAVIELEERIRQMEKTLNNSKPSR